MPKRKVRPVTVSAPQKGRSKLKGGIPLDELLAAHAAGRPAVATKKAPARVPAAVKPSKTKPKKAPGRRLPRRDDAKVIQGGPPRLVGYARIWGLGSNGTANSVKHFFAVPTELPIRPDVPIKGLACHP